MSDGFVIRDVKIGFFSWYSILGSKNSIFFDYRSLADVRNWFWRASSTAVRCQHADVSVVVPSAPRPRYSLAAFAAALVHSSNSHCLAHTNFSAPNSRPGYCGSTTVATTYRHSSVTAETKQTWKGIPPPPTCCVVVQLISRAVHTSWYRRVN